MDLRDLPSIKLNPIKTISPSKYFLLKECKLKFILNGNRLIRPLTITSPSAKVGLIVHKILELAIKGQIKDEHTMELAWQIVCTEIESQMKNNPLEKHMVPLELFADNFEVKRNMVFAIIRKLIKKEQNIFVSAKEQRYEAEKRYETSDGKIAGIIDLIKYSDLGVELIDYKTGSVVDPAENSLLKIEYQQQLKLYAALYYSVENVFPVRLLIIGIDQKEYVVEFNRNECLELIDSAKKELDKINKSILAGTNPDEFSSPSPDSCKYCPYRPICSAYWRQRQDDGKWPADVFGKIKEKKTLGNGLFRVVLETDQKAIAIRGLSPIRNIFLRDNVKKAMFCNLAPDSEEGFYSEGILTVGYPLE